MKTITPVELRQMMNSGQQFQLIDVREPGEHYEFNIGGELIPLGEITLHTKRIHTGDPVILYCRKGIRSQFAIQKLQDKFPFTNLYNLTGGVEAWRKMLGTE